MAKRNAKKQTVAPEKPRKNADAVTAPSKPDGFAHDVTVIQPADDLGRNPGIGGAKGTTMAGADTDLLEEDMQESANTFEGDVENEASLGGGADLRRVGRRNK